MLRYIYLWLVILAFNTNVLSQQIILDDSFDDWNSEVARYTDPSGDAPINSVDFTDIRISNDDRFLFLYIQLNREINIQEKNEITILIDIDNDLNTGRKTSGIGADIVYNLGKRQGFLHDGTNSYLIYHNHIGLVTSPTVTSSRFEIAIARNFTFHNENFMMSSQVRVAFSDETPKGDKAPDGVGGYEYSMNNQIQYNRELSLSKEDPSHLRIMSYNVLKDNLFNNSVRQNYSRIFKAVNPDIIGFCEIYNNSSSQVATLMEEFLPSTGSSKWYHSSSNPDIRIVSRYPIVNTRGIDGNGAFLINMGNEKLVAIVAHLPCCSNETQRQMEVDNIMAFVRGIRYGISPFQVPVNTPVVIMGDMNFVGYSQQLNTFITGDIINNSTYGPDFTPDWDDSNLEDLKPLTAGLPMTFTWNSDYGSYSAGRLDYMIYTGSVMQAMNSFVLWTPTMTNEQQLQFGLQSNDVVRASDHAPIVGDYKLGLISTVEEYTDVQPFVFRYRNGEWFLDSEFIGRLLVSDISGKILVDTKNEQVGEQIIHLPNLTGILIISFQTEQGIFSTKIFR